MCIVWGRILGRNPDKSLNSFPLCYSQSPLQLCLEISISSNARNLYSFYSSATEHRKGEKPDRKPYPLPFGLKKSIQKPQVWELSRLCPETSAKLYVHEFGFWDLFILYWGCTTYTCYLTEAEGGTGGVLGLALYTNSNKSNFTCVSVQESLRQI